MDARQVHISISEEVNRVDSRQQADLFRQSSRRDGQYIIRFPAKYSANINLCTRKLTSHTIWFRLYIFSIDPGVHTNIIGSVVTKRIVTEGVVYIVVIHDYVCVDLR